MATSKPVRLTLCAIAAAAGLAVAAPVARAQSQGDVGTMNCADYIRAQTAGGWTEGFTGKPGIDNLSPADRAKVHDYCTSHPQENARAAIGKAVAK